MTRSGLGPTSGRPSCEDAGATLVELLVSLLAGSIVLGAAAALFVPTIQNADRASRASQSLSTATTAGSLLQRQVTSATKVAVSADGRTLELCTYPTVTAGTRSTVLWTLIPNSAGTALALRSGSTLLGDQSSFATTSSFAPAGTTLMSGAVLNASLVTSGATGSGTTRGAASTSLAVTASPLSPQKVSCP